MVLEGAARTRKDPLKVATLIADLCRSQWLQSAAPQPAAHCILRTTNAFYCSGAACFAMLTTSGNQNIMRRSKEVNLTLLAALALSVTACKQQPRNCVDAQNHLLPDSVCQVDSSSNRNGSTGYYGGYGGGHWMYGGSSGGHMGDAVVGGSMSRGGFGAIGHSGGFGGGE